jgi:GTP-binding protein Era
MSDFDTDDENAPRRDPLADDERPPFRSGFVALVGRPNAGKSTLLNQLVGEKVAIVSNKPQTTRNQIRGWITRDDGQIVVVDTPGIHKPGYALNRRMMGFVSEALQTVDIILLLVDATAAPGSGDRFATELVFGSGKPVFLVLNKVDLVKDKSRLLPMLQQRSSGHEFVEVIPISARTGVNVDRLVETILRHLPEGPRYFPDDEYTDQPLRMLAAELVREQILHATGEEIPYVTAVITERWEETDTLVKVYCAVFVERSTQKAIIIGRGGQMLKEVGTKAREGLEEVVGKQVFLQIHVVVREHWRDDERLLDDLGIEG